MRLFVPWALGLALLLGLLGTAHADVPSIPRPVRQGPLAMDEPRSGLHLEVPGGCQVRPTDGGGAECASFAASAFQSEAFAVVLGPAGLLSYSVAMFASRESGGGDARARRVVATMGETAVGAPSLVTFGAQAFMRVELHTSNGAALCFVTVDDRPEVAVIMFASEPDGRATMLAGAEAVMPSARRLGAAPTTATAEASAQPSRGSGGPHEPGAAFGRVPQLLFAAGLVLVFGLPVLRVIRRTIERERARKKSRP